MLRAAVLAGMENAWRVWCFGEPMGDRSTSSGGAEVGGNEADEVVQETWLTGRAANSVSSIAQQQGSFFLASGARHYAGATVIRAKRHLRHAPPAVV